MDQGATPSSAEARAEPATSRLELQATEVGSVFVSNYPPFSQWNTASVQDYRQALEAPPGTEAPPLGLYLHIPFCRKRCKFCYFRLYTDKNSNEVETYCDALAREVEMCAACPAYENRPLKFVYFGGGTPSYIAAKHLLQLVRRIKAVFPWDTAREVAFECEPGTLSLAKLAVIRELGITRLSLGVQNFNDHILEINGRAHVSREIYKVLPWIQQLEFDQLNIDLIAGLIGETWDTWRESVQRTIDIGPESVTVYQMELPYNTTFSAQFVDGSLDVPLADWALKRQWHDYAFERLAEAGYELSSAYTMVRKDSGGRFVYRDSLWHGADMLGTGVSSFGHLSGIHVQNDASWASYLQHVQAGQLPLSRACVISADERLTREMILQLKTGRIQTAYFADKFGVDILDRFRAAFRLLSEQGMLRTSEQAVEVTRQGLLQVDTLLPEFYDPAYRDARYT